MSDTDVVATFGYRYEAEFARETLRVAGIESVLAGDDAGGAYAGMSFTRRIRLLVRSSELDRAREVLSAADADADADAE
jgi:hypothetical protein